MASLALHRVSKILIQEIGDSISEADGVRKIFITNDEGTFELVLFGRKAELGIEVTEKKTI